jgi:hypothetical protein
MNAADCPPAIVLHWAPPAPAQAEALDHDRFFDAIRQVEGHQWTDPGGALAFTRRTWEKLTSLPYRLSQRREYAEAVGRLLLQEFERECQKAGVEFTVRVAAGAWNKGLADAIRRERMGWPRDYSLRVENLFNDR